MPRPLFTLREKTGTHCTGGWVDPRTGLDGAENFASTPTPSGIQFPDCPSRSQSLYRLSYLAY